MGGHRGVGFWLVWGWFCLVSMGSAICSRHAMTYYTDGFVLNVFGACFCFACDIEGLVWGWFVVGVGVVLLGFMWVSLYVQGMQ